MTSTNINVAVLSESDHQRLPQQSLSLAFIPISPLASNADRHENLTMGTELHHCGAVGVRNPNIIPRVDGHAVRLFLVTDHLIADLQNKFVFRVELIELRTSERLALKHPKVPF